mmetsp:Transcript_89584/g.148920  ORF Transcript_89584/g.148920 Transcript_89584/m.148920 type:complete len:109 (+) Transcript_89584:537-863(+)
MLDPEGLCVDLSRTTALRENKGDEGGRAPAIVLHQHKSVRFQPHQQHEALALNAPLAQTIMGWGEGWGGGTDCETPKSCSSTFALMSFDGTLLMRYAEAVTHIAMACL